MIRFIKFSFTIINLSSIKYIDIQPNKYNIYLNDNELKTSYNLLKITDIYSKSNKIEISKNNHPYDYNKMSDWINNLD